MLARDICQRFSRDALCYAERVYLLHFFERFFDLAPLMRLSFFSSFSFRLIAADDLMPATLFPPLLILPLPQITRHCRLR